jgi:LysR family nitrogen assimilation transcriptional regulator
VAEGKAKLLDLKQLRYFVQIAECGSFSKAAELLRIAQPSLSLQVKNLEEELGVDLLIRHPRGVATTDLGMQFCEHARTILREVDRVKEIIRSQSTSPVGRVSVGLPTSACRGLSSPFLQAIAREHPGVTVHLVEAMTGSLDEWVQMGRLDVALLYDQKAFENVAWTEMMVEDLMLVVPAGAPIADAGQVPFEQLAELPLVLPSRLNVLRTILEQIAARANITLTAIDCDSLPAITQLVRDRYMTVMPHFAMSREIESGEMVALPIVDPSPSWRMSVVVSQRTINLRASDAVAQTMAGVIRRLVEDGIWRARLRSGERRQG